MIQLRRYMQAVALLACAASRTAAATPPLYVIAIGNNEPPSTSDPKAELLRYADDDASAFFQFLAPFSRVAGLLTVMDPDTQRRFPSETSFARPPSLEELRSIVDVVRRSVEQDQARGESPTVILFYSGHGSRASSGPPFLSMLDGGLTREILYGEILAALPARYVHLFVDACYAEAVVRPRDSDGATMVLRDDEAAQYAADGTLARFPNVGAIVSSTASSKSHEWDVYRHGVFTHELLSGLRGGADVNGDGKIEYSEMYAFLSAAGREIADSRARPSVVVRAPAENGRAPIVDLSQFRSGGRVASIPGAAGHVYIEDQVGNRLADIHGERGTVVSVDMPVGRVLYLHSALGEAQVRLGLGESVAFDRLSWNAPRNRERGSMDSAMRLGLFAAEFGPGYYRGFVDRSSDLVPVTFSENEPATNIATTAEAPRPLSPESATLMLALGVERGIARPQQSMPSMRVGFRSRGAARATLDLDAGWTDDQAHGEGRAVISGGYSLAARWRSVGILLGAAAGVGLAAQRFEGSTWSYTGLLSAGPCAGAFYSAAAGWGVVLEATASELLWEEDGRLTLGFRPTVFAGALVRL